MIYGAIYRDIHTSLLDIVTSDHKAAIERWALNSFHNVLQTFEGAIRLQIKDSLRLQIKDSLRTTYRYIFFHSPTDIMYRGGAITIEDVVKIINDPNVSLEVTPAVPLEEEKRCECGAAKCGSNRHSDWCPLGEQ
jgi:hypothetical protein